MATPGEQKAPAAAAAAEEVVSVEMPAPDGWTKKVMTTCCPPSCLSCLSARSLARSALLRFASDFGGSRGGIRGVCGSWEAEFDFPGREF